VLGADFPRPRSNRDVRLELAAARLAHPRETARFHDEISAAARLAHPRETRPAATATSSPRTSSPARGTELALELRDAQLDGDEARARREQLAELAAEVEQLRACVAVEALPLFEAEAKERQRAGGREKGRAILPEAGCGRAREHAAGIADASPRYVEEAKAEAIARAEAPTPPAGSPRVGAGAPTPPPGDEDLRRALLEAIDSERKAREDLEARVQRLEDELAGRRDRVAREARRRRRAAKGGPRG
jgi:hypothetical protein